MNPIEIFTDGSCLGNPGPGGWAAILRHPRQEKELSGGFARTTNNRMEILAVVEALACINSPCQIDLYTDSQYVAKAIEAGWLINWQRNGWKTAAKKPVKNQDLWIRLDSEIKRLAQLAQSSKSPIRFHWLKGHAGHPENERCDILAKAQASRLDLPPDLGMAE